MLVKEKNEHKDFTISDSKISFLNVHSTLVKSCIGDAYDYDVDTVSEVGDKDVIRYHVAPNDLGEITYPNNKEAVDQPWSLYIIPGKATDLDSFKIVPYSQYEDIKKQYNIKE